MTTLSRINCAVWRAILLGAVISFPNIICAVPDIFIESWVRIKI